MSNLTPIEDLPAQHAFPSCIAHQKNIGPKIMVAISIIAALGAIFIFLAAYNLLPPQNNLISELGLWGKITGGALLILAMTVGIVARRWLDCELRPSNESPPVHIVSETQRSIITNSDSATVPVSSCDFSILEEWRAEKSFSSREDICANITKCYHNIPIEKVTVECDEEISSLYAVLAEWKEDAAENKTELLKREAAASQIIQQYEAVRPHPWRKTTTSVPAIPKALRSILREWVGEAKGDKELGLRGLASHYIRRYYHQQNGIVVLENLKSLPDIFDYFGHIKDLTLHRCSLSICPPSIGNLKNLKRLVFTECAPFKALPAPICNLTSLKTLGIHWGSSQVPGNIDQLSNLEHLDLSSNSIEMLPDTIGKLQNLKKLVLEDNSLTALPQCIANLKALEDLWINNNRFTSLPDWLFEMPSLVLIKTESNRFSHETAAAIIVQVLKQRAYSGSLISCSISSPSVGVEQGQYKEISNPSMQDHNFGNFPALEEWKNEVIDNKKRARICENIERCYAHMPLEQITAESAEMIAYMYPMLEEWIDEGLNHKECQKREGVAEHIIKIYIAMLQQKQPEKVQDYTSAQLPLALKIPKEVRFRLRQWVSEAKSAEEYSCRETESRKIRVCYRRQIRLLHLDAVSSLPDIFDYLKHVVNISLHDCGRLPGYLLPDSFGRLQNLKTLSLSLCAPFENLPEPICNLHNLEQLVILGCDLTSVPNNIDILSNLTRLVLCRNRIRRLPESMRRLNKLNYLNLSENLLTTLPEFIGEFHDLQTLDISRNLFEFFPDWLLATPSITNLSASNNHFSYETVSAINQRVTQMREGGVNLDWSFSVYSPEQLNVMLEEIIVFWEKQFQMTFPSAEDKQQIFENLTAHKKKNFLAVFLSKAKDCEDFKTSARSLMILEIHEMLHAAENHEPFREELFILVEEGDDACSDKVAVFLNYVRGHRLISQAENLSDLSLAKLVIGIERLDQLDSVVRKMSRLSVDPLEMILKFQITLRDVLSLPVITQKMLFPLLGAVNDEKIEEVKNVVLSKTSNFASILISSTQWIKSIQKNNLAAFEEIKKKYICPEADSFPNDAAYMNASNTMKQQREQAIQEAILKFTQQWLEAHPQFLSI